MTRALERIFGAIRAVMVRACGGNDTAMRVAALAMASLYISAVMTFALSGAPSR
jgi:hypothetical protein